MSNLEAQIVPYDSNGVRAEGFSIPNQTHFANDVLFRCNDGGVATHGDMFPEYYKNTGEQMPTMFDASGNKNPQRYADVYPGPNNVHENAALTDFAVRFELDSNMFIATELAPIFTVNKRSDVFYKVAKGDVSRAQKTERAVGANANEIQQGFDKDNYDVVNYALRAFLPDQMVNNADEALDLMASTTRFLTQVLGFGRDRRVMALLVTGNFGNATASAAGGGKWNVSTEALKYIQLGFNAANTQIIRNNLGAGMNKTFFTSTTALAVAASPELQGSAKHIIGDSYVVNGGWPGENYGLPGVLYGAQNVIQAIPTNTAKKGQADVLADSYTDNAFFCRTEAPSRQTRNCITTFRQGGMTTKSYRDEGRNGVYVEVEQIEDIHITNADGGYLLTDAL